MLRSVSGLIVFAVMMFSTSANAAAMTQMTQKWAVSDATSQHGLWTNNRYFNGDRFFNFTSDTYLTEFDNGTATLKGGAADSGITWVIDLLFSNFSEDPVGPVKTGGGPLLDSWYFYQTTSGTISTTDAGGFVANINRVGPAFQIGLGANDKTSDFGGSAWLGVNGGGGPTHWDLNMNLTAVPEPSVLMLFTAGLIGLGFVRRRQRIG